MDISTIKMLISIMVAGGFGGFVDGLLHKKSYCFHFGAISKDIGSIGDILVGTVSSLAIFTVAGSLLGIQWANVGQPEHFIRIIAWGVLSGYAGIRILNPLTREAVERLAHDKAQEVVKQSTRQSIETSMALKDAERYLVKYDMQHQELEAQGKSKDAEDLLKRAGANYDIVLGIESTNSEALRGKAKFYRRLAERVQATDPMEGRKYWQMALQLLTDIIQRDDNAALAYYNRACYKALSGNPDGAFDDLGKAIKIYDQLRESAIADKDFNMLKEQSDRFHQVIKQG